MKAQNFTWLCQKHIDKLPKNKTGNVNNNTWWYANALDHAHWDMCRAFQGKHLCGNMPAFCIAFEGDFKPDTVKIKKLKREFNERHKRV